MKRRYWLCCQSYHFLPAGMIVKRSEINIVLHPGLRLMVGLGKQVLQQIERWLGVAQKRVNAGDVILGQNVIRIESQRTRSPFPGTRCLTELR